ncbi:MAG: hypothetical protein A3J63_01590 [Candidatus Moranbacteria bacterium RIFCSPHIGHO2_02_FULL_40_12b]|nr:MAG: hypothetical protein A3J63_01590 [Candidatus Moranbacteria bacterium RIFCSPHIGHO2_02_FULL_40_12b]OGI23494.1 MAG: hypothetical protein A3E91_01790 [Candidatus Moranbacteria bacterium RIFCSPHIGHO2_12_FULL_40_10]
MKLSVFEWMLIATTLLEFNPLFQAVKSIKNKSVQDVSPFVFMSIMAIGSMWLAYGITIDSVPLIIGNAIKLFSSLSVLVIYFRYKNKKVKNKTTH